MRMHEVHKVQGGRERRIIAPPIAMRLDSAKRLGVLLLPAMAVALAAQSPRDRHVVGPEAFTLRVVASALDNPWDLAWGPDGGLWVTERTGFRVTRLDPADGSKHVALTLTDVYQSVVQDGLLGFRVPSRSGWARSCLRGVHLRPRSWT